MNQAQQIAKILLDVSAVKVKVSPPFTWSSGLAAPIYCDNRLLISYPNERRVIIDAFKKIIEENNIEFDVIGGTASAAIPWGAFLAYELEKPMVYIRKSPKGYGTDKYIEGYMKENDRILIVEDLISTGGSSLRAAEACQNEYNADVVAVLAIFSYEMRASANAFKDVSFPLYTLSGFSTLIDVATQHSLLREYEKVDALAWSNDPEAWSKEHGGV